MSEPKSARRAAQRVAEAIASRAEAWRRDELAKAVGCSLAAVGYCLHHLERRGAVRRIDRFRWVSASAHELDRSVADPGAVKRASVARGVRSPHRELRNLNPIDDDLVLVERRWRERMGPQRYQDVATIKPQPLLRALPMPMRSMVGCAAALCAERRAGA